MWTYFQNRGTLYHDDIFVGVGYAGRMAGCNNSNYESIKNMGPLPRGLYTFGNPVDHPKLGPHAIPLIPESSNKMYGRDEFFCHGDSLDHPGFASDGCIVMIISVRLMIIQSPDKQLQVISG